MQIHVAKNGQQTGPFDEALVREKLAQGEFAPTDLAWHADLAGWQPLSTLFPGEPSAPSPVQLPPAPPAPSPVAAVPVFPPGSATPLPAPGYAPPGGGYTPLPVAGGPPGQMVPPQFYNPAIPGVDPNLATVGERILGLLVDAGVHLLFVSPGLVLTLVHVFSAAQSNPNDVAAISAARGGLALALALLGNVAVYVVQGYIFSKSGQTIGKKVMGTRVVLLNGQRAGLVPGFLVRTVLPNFGISLLGQIPLLGSIFSCLGLFYYITDFCFLFRQDHRCVHDLFAGTKVVRAGAVSS